jgi:iron complex outermembrane receptor protein/hemoglobin/transferrin/lactoferrin receptor protein
VTRRELAERLPRSAPDALRYEPGVYVQQTAHGQGSAYIRGRTGQQTVMLFDGIRLNNSTFRQGPNQYFFTIDARTIDRIDVLRGGASTLHGSDAIGGVINALPIRPRLDPGARKMRFTPGAMFRYGSADGEVGGRLQLDAQLQRRIALFGGVGYRQVGLLRSGGPILSPTTGEAALVPRMDDDGITQLGTDFNELASDLSVVLALSERARLTTAFYDYRQFDSPRTDLCPPPYAPRAHCVTYEEQFRTLAYASLDADLHRAAREVRVALSYQNQHERRLYDRPASLTQNGGRDDVHTFGLVANLQTARFRPSPHLAWRLRYGGDLYHDRVRSAAWTTFTDLEVVTRATRGQYLEGSSYTWGGLYLQGETTLLERLILRAGGRLSGVAARAPADEESGTHPIGKDWLTAVGQIGVEASVVGGLSLLANLDRSFRAPNLDDLTSRQQTGPGFQFENSDLDPETALTAEVGARLDVGWLQGAAWLYWTSLEDGIERSPRDAADCPPETPQCNASWSRFQLVNLGEPATIYGAEAILRAFLPWGFSTRATVAWAYGDGPNPQDPPADPALPHVERVPLSRVPPLNGTLELRWKHCLRGHGYVYVGAGLRWATAQTRLSLGDVSDERIPEGGTPGFAVLDLRAGLRIRRRLFAGLTMENIIDSAYRYHGSSINGPGRGVRLNIEGHY